MPFGVPRPAGKGDGWDQWIQPPEDHKQKPFRFSASSRLILQSHVHLPWHVLSGMAQSGHWPLLTQMPLHMFLMLLPTVCGRREDVSLFTDSLWLSPPPRIPGRRQAPCTGTRRKISRQSGGGGACRRRSPPLPLLCANHTHAPALPLCPPKHNHRTNCKCENFPCSQLQEEKVTFSWPGPCMANGRAGLQK